MKGRRKPAFTVGKWEGEREGWQEPSGSEQSRPDCRGPEAGPQQSSGKIPADVTVFEMVLPNNFILPQRGVSFQKQILIEIFNMKNREGQQRIKREKICT